MRDTEFLRSDELPGRTAIGYLPIEGRSRTNVFHLPVLGSGDGGIYSTAADISAFWQSLFAERIVSWPWVAEMVRPRSEVPAEHKRYGLGFWLHQSTDTVMLEGYDAGVSFRTVHDPASAPHAHRHFQQLRRRLAHHRPTRRATGNLISRAYGCFARFTTIPPAHFSSIGLDFSLVASTSL